MTFVKQAWWLKLGEQHMQGSSCILIEWRSLPITTFNWAIFHYHFLMTSYWQSPCFWERTVMKSFISLFSDCLTTSDSIKSVLSNALIIFEWERLHNAAISPPPGQAALCKGTMMHAHEQNATHVYLLCRHNMRQQFTGRTTIFTM